MSKDIKISVAVQIMLLWAEWNISKGLLCKCMLRPLVSSNYSHSLYVLELFFILFGRISALLSTFHSSTGPGGLHPPVCVQLDPFIIYTSNDNDIMCAQLHYLHAHAAEFVWQNDSARRRKKERKKTSFCVRMLAIFRCGGWFSEQNHNNCWDFCVWGEFLLHHRISKAGDGRWLAFFLGLYWKSKWLYFIWTY